MRKPREILLSFEFYRHGVNMSGDRFCRQDYMLFKEIDVTIFTFNPSILAINIWQSIAKTDAYFSFYWHFLRTLFY